MITDDEEEKKQRISQFLSCLSNEDLALFLKIKHSTLIFYAYRNTDKNYKSFILTKKNGGVREINTPSSNLKLIQSSLNNVLNDIYIPPASTHGFVQNKSIKTNAIQHTGRKYILNADIKDFFPSINFGRVYGLFLSKPFSFNKEVATTLAKICCHNNCLPQGAPSSPIISNFISLRLDNQLIKFSKSNYLFYSRYADDLSFSSNSLQFIRSAISEKGQITNELENIITSNGFVLNTRKVYLRKKFQLQVVNGLTVNKFPNLNRIYYRNNIRAPLNSINKYGLFDAQTHFNNFFDWKQRTSAPPSLKDVLDGRISFLKFIHDIERFKNKRKFKVATLIKHWESIKEREEIILSLKNNLAKVDAIIITEGQTDWLYLKAALRSFKEKNIYGDLNIIFWEFDKSVSNSNSELVALCKSFSKRKICTKFIFIADNDDVKITNQLMNNGYSYKEWSSSTYSFCIPKPSNREHFKDIFIELYFTNKDLMTLDKKNQNKRLVINEELKDEKTIDNSQKSHNIKRLKSDIIDFSLLDKPFKIYDKTMHLVKNSKDEQMALSKMNFAHNINNKVEGFENIDFSNFSKIFDIIKDILND